MYFLTKELFFPPVSEANHDGILAIAGDLSSERLLLAYKSGIFPWFEEGEPQMARICSNYLVLIAQNCILCLQSRANNTSQKKLYQKRFSFFNIFKAKKCQQNTKPQQLNKPIL